MLQPEQLFGDLPKISGASDLSNAFGVSDDIIYRMAHNGMPHTHVGREYRFHRTLLIEWTRGGEVPYTCATCAAKKIDKPTIEIESYMPAPADLSSKEDTRNETLARLARK